MVELVLTVVARDRPGIVEILAEKVAAHSGNWIDSAMTRLGGEFAGVLRAEVPDDQVIGLKQALAGLAQEGIDVTVRTGEPPEPSGGHHVRLALTGLDHKGIVLEVTRVLSRLGVSIDELQTNVFAGSMGGEKMFSADAKMILPDGLDIDSLREALEKIASDIMVDIELAEVSG